jgi:hypothetical protein
MRIEQNDATKLIEYFENQNPSKTSKNQKEQMSKLSKPKLSSKLKRLGSKLAIPIIKRKQ